MKPMTELEIDHELKKLESFHGYWLSNVLYDEKVLQLSLSSEENFLWLTFSLKPGHPYFFVGDKKTKTIKGLKKPLSTFAMTHFKDMEFRRGQRLKEKGRVIQLSFADEKLIEVILFPGGQNVLVQVGQKQVFAYKPKDLVQKSDPDKVANVRKDLQDYSQIWTQKFVKKSGGDSFSDRQAEIKKMLKKKQSGIRKMEEKLAKLEKEKWAEAGQWLKNQQNISGIGSDFADYVDKEKSLSWNIENCFNQAKKAVEKRQGTLERIEIIRKEMEDLETGQWKKPKEFQKSLLKVADAQGRTRELSGGFRLFVGKSAKDNLALLRRAKPWYLWLHIRDYPGAYGIIERPRKASDPSHELLKEAAGEVVKQSLKSQPLGVYEVIFAECRYVRPIPKMKAGQVTYSHEKVVRIEL